MSRFNSNQISCIIAPGDNMRVLIQRVSHASCTVDGNITGQIQRGYLLFVGITHSDTEHICDLMADKIINLRVFEDKNNKMNLSLSEIKGEILLISQFTLYGDARKGRRPNFMNALCGEQANILYEKVIESLKETGVKVETGIFGADMKVEINNDGPVTILLDSSKNF